MTEEELKERIAKAAEALRREGAQEVYVFGSAATGHLREGGDVDLAVSGLPPRRYLDALGEAIDILQAPVDLLDLDQDNPFSQHLKEERELVRVG
jgi:predicted nucleotidyltransferase